MDTQSFEFNIFFEIHQDLPREGPGGNQSTRQAYSMLPELPEKPRILDVGCGPGMQTLELARISGGHITAVDNHQPFLDALAKSAAAEGLSDRIETVNASMLELPFGDESFDLIWSEGAIYIMGLAEGLRQWKRLLKPGGAVAVTEVSWLKSDPPDELKDFWTESYPAMTNVAGNLRTIHRCGYETVGHFTLPTEDWWTHYYTPLGKRVVHLRQKHAENPAALAVLDVEDLEMDLHRRYSDYYGYVFYMMRKA